MTALFTGSMLINDGFSANGVPQFNTYDDCKNYIMGENGDASPRQITRQLGNIANTIASLNLLSYADNAELIKFIGAMEKKSSKTRKEHICTIINHLQADITQNSENEDQNNNGGDEVATVRAQTEGMKIEPEVDYQQLDALSKSRKRAHNEMYSDVNNNGDGYLAHYAKRIKKIVHKANETLQPTIEKMTRKTSEALQPAMDYVKENPGKSAAYAAEAVVMSTGTVTIAKKLYDLCCYWIGYLGW